ncbi:SigB/SigF/SigG family RNA polymerase sigma factor [Streptomyces sp. NPDC048512]|uniref:SigB/SigF/SigG family RNA polymerase sigma factor n=1 Tax=Streptomyces sp. NPDC048512 TaxID=3365563 RepID=UPI00371D1985
MHEHERPAASDALFTHLVGLEPGREREAVRAELVQVWLPMAHRVAGRFRDRGEDIDDLRQVAALGLVKAIDRFDPTQGAFESYAIPTITGELKRHFRDRTWAVHVPRRIQELRTKVRTARHELNERPGSHEPTPVDIAAHTGLTLEEVTAGLAALDSYATMSLDMELDWAGDGYSLRDTLGAIDRAFDTTVDREAAKQGLRRLPERERAILYLRFFEDMTQSSIAERFRISQMQVCRLIKHSCARVREEALA